MQGGPVVPQHDIADIPPMGIDKFRFRYPIEQEAMKLKAELISRTVVGNKVFDHELIHGLGEQPLENMAVFEVREGLIQSAWFYSANPQ